MVDRVGDDHVEVVAKAGDEIDKHCRARIDVVKHDMELALHDTKGIAYTARFTAIEAAGRWYLSKIPIAEPAGSKPAAVALPAPLPDELPKLPRVELDLAPGDCAGYLKELERLRSCTVSQETRSVMTTALQEISDRIATSGKRALDADDALSRQCKSGLDMLHKGLFGC